MFTVNMKDEEVLTICMMTKLYIRWLYPYCKLLYGQYNAYTMTSNHTMYTCTQYK